MELMFVSLGANVEKNKPSLKGLTLYRGAYVSKKGAFCHSVPESSTSGRCLRL